MCHVVLMKNKRKCACNQNIKCLKENTEDMLDREKNIRVHFLIFTNSYHFPCYTYPNIRTLSINSCYDHVQGLINVQK